MNFSKRGEAERGLISRVDIAALNFGRSSKIVTTVRDSNNKLKLIVWDVSSSGQLTAQGSLATDGTIKEVAIVSVGGNMVVTVLRDSQDTLRLVAWEVTSNGNAIARRGTRTDVNISKLAAASRTEGGGNTEVFVAARSLSGNLHVGYWPVTEDGVILEPRTDSFGQIDDVAASDGVSNVAAVKIASNELRLIHFWSPLFRGGMGTGGKISKIAIADLGGGGFAGQWLSVTASPGPIGVFPGFFSRRLLVPMGFLKVITWEVENTSLQANLVRTAEAEVRGHAGMTKDLAALALQGHSMFVTAHRGVGTWKKLLERDQGKPELRLIAWKPRSDSIERVADKTLGGDYTQISMAQVAHGDVRSRFVTAMRDKSGNMRVVVWDFE